MKPPYAESTIDAQYTTHNPPYSEMYAYSSFPSRFAVFRGPYHSTLRTEMVDSIMVFDTTPSEDGSFYTATMRPWFGTIVGGDDMPDKMVRQVKIHSPSRKDYHGNPFSPSNERFVVLPFTLEVNATSWVHNAIPILAFESSNWMPRFEPLNAIQMLNRIQGDSFKYHYQNLHYIAGVLMRRQEPLPPYITWLQSLADPYAQMNRAEICTIPYAHISPTNIHTLRRTIIEDYYHRNTAAFTVIDAAVAAPAMQPPPELPHLNELDGFTEDYSSMFDGAAGYVPPADDVPALPSIPDFILENHLNQEVQKGTECPITFEPLSSLAEVAMSRDCGHFFEQAALKAWGKVQQNEGKQIVCPVCRKALSEVVTMANNYYIPVTA